jgi:hypothetical protein
LQFPQALPDPSQESAAVNAAQSEAQSARMLAMAGIGVGLLGLIAAVGVWLTRPRTAVPAQRPAGEHA